MKFLFHVALFFLKFCKKMVGMGVCNIITCLRPATVEKEGCGRRIILYTENMLSSLLEKG